MAAIKEDGQCNEIAWPYGDAGPADVSATYYRASDDARERNSLVDFVRASLAEGRSALLTLRLTEAWYSVGKDGVIAPPSATDRVLLGHAVVAVGYDAPQQRILIRNSWGERWGDGGHAWIPDSFVRQHGLQAVTLVALPVSIPASPSDGAS
jgi:hypothetical protein